MQEKLSYLKKKRFVFGAIVLVLILGSVLIFKNRDTGKDTIVIKLGDFINQVSISGKVVASDSVELGFKNSGRIERVYFSVEKLAEEKKIINAGTVIAEIDTSDIKKSIHDAEIDLEEAKISLEKIKLESSDENLNSDLQKAYDDGFVEISDTFLDLSPTITGLKDILNQENLSDSAARDSGLTARNYRNEAEKLYFKAKDLFEENRNNFRSLNKDSSRLDIEKIINETYNTTKVLMDAIKSTKNLTEYMSEDTDQASSFTSTQNTLYGYTNTINEHFSNLLSIKNNIKDYKDAFSSNDLNIQSLLLSVKQKENALQDEKNKLNNYYIRAPFDGIITKIDAKVGEMASSNIPLVTMIGAGTFQVESYVPEVNIAKISIGNDAQITLDAYGEDHVFLAKVVSIDPAETVRNGVSTYKTKLQFIEKDDRIRPGMTANVAVTIFKKPNAIVVPGGVIFSRDGKNFVQVKIDKEIIEKEVVLGDASSLGQVEIISGLSEGESVVLNPILK